MSDREWLTSTEAAAVLGVSPQQVRYLARQGYFDAERVGKQWRFDAAGVRAEADDRQLWVSYLQAAELTGSDHHAVWRAVQAGEIEGRDVHRSRPSLLRSSVIKWGRWHTAQTRERLQSRERLLEARERRNRPPDETHVWLDRETAAIVLGVSASRIQKLAADGRLPVTKVAGSRRLWFRRDHVECVAAARVLQGVSRPRSIAEDCVSRPPSGGTPSTGGA